MKKYILILLLFISGCQNYSELNQLAIVTAAGIDKDKGKYEVSVLIANSPKVNSSNKEGEAKTTVYKAKGKTIGEAIKMIELKSPKELYFSHINCIIISNEIGKEGFLKVADYFMRNPETRNRFYLLQIDKGKSSDVLKIISPLESYPSQSIKTLIESSQTSSNIGDSASYSNFIGKTIQKGYDPIMTTIKINGDKDKGSKQSNLETTEPNTYLSMGPIAIYKNDKLISLSSNKETELIRVINNENKELNYNFKYKGKNVNMFSNMTKTSVKLINKNFINVDIYIKGDIFETDSNVNLNNYKEVYKINKKWQKNVKKDVKKLIDKIKHKWKSDIFGFGNMVYKKYPDHYKNFKLDKIKVNVKVKTEIISTGSLTKVIKEDK